MINYYTLLTLLCYLLTFQCSCIHQEFVLFIVIFFFFPLKDVESYDPILNPVLNREVRRTGGRVLITLGDQDIDLSPSFVIFLSTRDPTVSRLSFYVINR